VAVIQVSNIVTHIHTHSHDDSYTHIHTHLHDDSYTHIHTHSHDDSKYNKSHFHVHDLFKNYFKLLHFFCKRDL